MRRRSSSFVGIRRHRLLILGLPLLFVVAFLFQSNLRFVTKLDIFPSFDHTTRHHHGGKTAANPRPYKIAKATMLFDQNDLYERALNTHRHHNAKHGYKLKVLDRPVTEGYWNKLLYLLSLMTEELAKPAEDRLEWLMWLDAHVVVTNPKIPLDPFLPTRERLFRDTHFIGTRHDGEFNPSSFFIRVHPWSIKLLVKTMAVPMIDEQAEMGSVMDQRALSYILNETEYRSAVVYQPASWFDGEHLEGAMMAQFPADLKGARWKRLSDVLDQVEQMQGKELSYHESFYESAVDKYWERAKNLNFMLLVTKELQKAQSQWNHELSFISQRLQDILDYEVDQRNPAEQALEEARSMVKQMGYNVSPKPA